MFHHIQRTATGVGVFFCLCLGSAFAAELSLTSVNDAAPPASTSARDKLLEGSNEVAAAATLNGAQVRCNALYSLRGHRKENDDPADCGNGATDGPEIPQLVLSQPTVERTVSDTFSDLNMRFERVQESEVTGMVRWRPRGRSIYSAVVNGPLSGDRSLPLSLTAYVGERTATDRPHCAFSTYVTVSCSLRRP